MDSVARTRHSLHLRSLLIEQHSSLTRYSICFRKNFLTFDPLRPDSGILDCRNLGERVALDETDTWQVAYASALCGDCDGLRYSPLCDSMRYSSRIECYLSRTCVSIRKTLPSCVLLGFMCSALALSFPEDRATTPARKRLKLGLRLLTTRSKLSL